MEVKSHCHSRPDKRSPSHRLTSSFMSLKNIPPPPPHPSKRKQKTNTSPILFRFCDIRANWHQAGSVNIHHGATPSITPHLIQFIPSHGISDQRPGPGFMTTPQPIYCTGGRKSASLVQLSPDALTAPDWVTKTSVVQPTFWDSDGFNFLSAAVASWHPASAGLVWDVVMQPRPDQQWGPNSPHRASQVWASKRLPDGSSAAWPTFLPSSPSQSSSERWGPGLDPETRSQTSLLRSPGGEEKHFKAFNTNGKGKGKVISGIWYIALRSSIMVQLKPLTASGCKTGEKQPEQQ